MVVEMVAQRVVDGVVVEPTRRPIVDSAVDGGAGECARAVGRPPFEQVSLPVEMGPVRIERQVGDAGEHNGTLIEDRPQRIGGQMGAEVGRAGTGHGEKDAGAIGEIDALDHDISQRPVGLDVSVELGQ